MQDLYTEHYKILLREIKGDLISGETSYVHGPDLVLLRCQFCSNWSIVSRQTQ